MDFTTLTEAEAVPTGEVMYQCSKCGHREYRPPGEKVACPMHLQENPDYDARVDPDSPKYVAPVALDSADQEAVLTVADVERIMEGNGRSVRDELAPKYGDPKFVARTLYPVELVETEHKVYAMTDPRNGRQLMTTLYENPDGVTVNIQSTTSGAFDGPEFPNVAEAAAWARGYLFGSGAFVG